MKKESEYWTHIDQVDRNTGLYHGECICRTTSKGGGVLNLCSVSAVPMWLKKQLFQVKGKCGLSFPQHYLASWFITTISDSFSQFLLLSLSPCVSLCSSGSMVSGWRWLWMTGCQYAKAVCSSATLTPATSIGALWWRRPMPSQLPLPAYVSGL